MDDSIQFIIESPQTSQGHRKRPRLVTSCDNCRLKKIKCLQPSPEAKCEACKTAKISCRFRDRERYFAERSRAITGPQPSYGGDKSPSVDSFSVPPSRSSTPAARSHVRAPSQPTGVVIPDGEQGNRYSSYSPDSRRSVDSSHRLAGQSSMSAYPSSGGYSYMPPTSYSRPDSPQMARSTNILFDPEMPQSPNPNLMSHFVTLFFEHMGREFTFINYDDIVNQIWESRLCPHLANSIAGMASRYSHHPDLSVRGLHNVAEAYTDNAKTLIAADANQPTIDILHALMLITWSEYKNTRMSSFRTYCQMAMRMAVDLGLSDQTPPPLHISDAERSRRRTTWAGILQLHMTASSLR